MPELPIVPRFIGDGKGERYVDREHKDCDGNVVLELDTMFFVSNIMQPHT